MLLFRDHMDSCLLMTVKNASRVFVGTNVLRHAVRCVVAEGAILQNEAVKVCEACSNNLKRVRRYLTVCNIHDCIRGLHIRLPLLALFHGFDASKSSNINTSTVDLSQIEMSNGRVGLELLNLLAFCNCPISFSHFAPIYQIVLRAQAVISDMT